jgi:hypothetical protein
MRYLNQVEYADRRKLRDRNTVLYRFAHWPIWIWVFFISPGPLTFRLFARGPNLQNGAWLAAVMAGTGIAGLFGQLPGSEPRPYILRFTEDRPNPLYRRICYTFAWNAAVTYALLNLAGLLDAARTGRWRMDRIHGKGYFPLSAVVLSLGALGQLPRVKASTQGEGTERRYFYGTVWAATISQALLLAAWKTLPSNRATNRWKLAGFLGALCVTGGAAMFGLFPRTRRILPGSLVIAD